ncbi:HAMP domain-containing histidine kinase [bacterium]|nr:HAMP domain-containing histidine kinase [bacterium]
MAWWPQSLKRLRKRHIFTAYLLVGSLIIFMAISQAAFRVADRVEEQARLSTWLLSHFASLHLAHGQIVGLGEVLTRTREMDVPFIVTDNQGRPVLWNGTMIGIPMPDEQETLAGIDPEGGNGPELDRILELIREYDARNEPFAITDPATGQRMLTLHYGASVLGRHIRWMPYLELMLLVVFFLLIVWALNVKWDGDEQKLFAGMAKETAHQLGTPITSILGWLAILRDRASGEDEVVEEIGRDVSRLGKVSERFSKIGSRPRLDDTDLQDAVMSAVAYFEKRLPHLSGRVDLRCECELNNLCRFNRDLMEWVLENLIKNGIDALPEQGGTILARLDDGPRGGALIRVSDTGSGIPSAHRNRIFEAGFTTKSRGWGMGLALVKRIIVQYHGGRIQVERTGATGTTFLITLPGEGN